MDTWEATTAVFERVRALDPARAAKIVGLLLVHDDDERRTLARLAVGPDHLLRSFVARARAELLAASKPCSSAPALLAPPSPRADDDRVLQGCDASSHPDHCWSPVSGGGLRRSLSLSDAGGRLPHTLPPEEEGSVAVMRRARSMSARPPPPRHADPAFASFPPSPKGLNDDEFVFPQQQSDAQRSAAAAAMLQPGGGEDLMMSRFSVMTRSPQIMDLLMHSPAALQIYMTFPAESTFTEDDVSNYFSKYGAVQDVRIPYQQRRMFGFVTFVYPETVTTVLSMRNPHLVCAARVLVKPYKDKAGKVLLHRKLSSRPHHGEFTATPTGLLDPRDARFDDLHQPQIGPRNIASQQEAVLRRKLLQEEQQQQQQAADELQQQAIGLQSHRRFTGLQLLDLNSRAHRRLGSPVKLTSPISPPGQTDGGKGSADGDGSNAVRLEDVVTAENKQLNSGSSTAMCAPAFSAVSGTAAEGKREEQQKQEEDADGSPAKNAVNPAGAGDEKKMESGLVAAAAPNVTRGGFEESAVVDHNLPASLLDDDCAAATAQNDNMNPYHVAYSLFPPRSSLDLPPNNSCLFFQVPRFTSGHEAIEL